MAMCFFIFDGQCIVDDKHCEMTYEEMDKTMDRHIDRYFCRGIYKDSILYKEGSLRFKERLKQCRYRLRAFILENNIPQEIKNKIEESGMGEDFRKRYGYEILSEEEL
jgi:hypothetical protein